ncbi:MAG: hypothetical protein EP330_25565 [Deltaproteobacteria bacterium]|nr:MAG: hypothetical protein EP330_25565 [Deltaproteobacteria bacterium]
MSKRVPVRILAAGAALSVSLTACGPKNGGMTENPPPPEPEVEAQPEEVEPVTSNPPPVEVEAGALPTWDEVASGHPEGATNPPSPFLRVTPEGECYKFWRGMMAPPRPGEIIGDRVQACEEGADCGTQIQCPEPRASELLEAFNSGEQPAGKPIPAKPEGL